MKSRTIALLFLGVLLWSCEAPTPQEKLVPSADMSQKLAKYETVRLTTDLSVLSDNQKEMVRLLINAAAIMDDLFWYEAYGDKEGLLASMPDEAAGKYASINYGPWDRLENNAPFFEGVGEKPKGANFYPADMSKEEF